MRLYTTSDTKKTLLFNLAPCVKSCFDNNLKLMFDYQGDSVLDTVLHTPGANALTKPEKFIIPKVFKRKYSNISGDPFKLEDDIHLRYNELFWFCKSVYTWSVEYSV